MEPNAYTCNYLNTSAYFFACAKGMGKGEKVVKNFNFLHNTYQMDDPYIPMYYTYRQIHTHTYRVETIYIYTKANY